MVKFVLALALFLLLFLALHAGGSSGDLRKDTLRKTRLPACKACKVFIDSFLRSVKRTEKGKFDGGNVAWEEQRLGNYAGSEIRLVEIQEYTCSDVEEGREQCYRFQEEYDANVENWWWHHQKDHPDLFHYFCIQKLKYCCPNNHYGPNCTACPGYPNHVCFNNGKCIGGGTRSGNGKCACNRGYVGEICDSCDEKYFEAYSDIGKVLCSPCPSSCKGPCTKAGCEECATGWLKNDKGDCIDVNECALSKPPCNSLQFCVNTDGAYKCLECDRSCAGCTGDGPDMCIKCARGYVVFGNLCIDDSQEERTQYVYYTRILTYIGLCIATCITYQKNVILAAIIGLAVAIYITVSEFILNSSPEPNVTELAEKLLQNN